MNFAAAALLGLTIGQPLGQDYVAMNARQIRLPIKYEKDRRAIRQVVLYVARNGENTWYQEGVVTPDKDAFVYTAPADGVYWFKMQIEDVKGNKDPADLTRDPPDLKMVIDTEKPVIRVADAKRNGDEITIVWSIEDKFPNDAETKVQFRPTANPNAYWQDVTLHPSSRNGVKFPSGTGDGVTVKITAADVAGNRTELTRDIPVGSTTALSSPPSDTQPRRAGMGTDGGTPPPAAAGTGAVPPVPPTGAGALMPPAPTGPAVAPPDLNPGGPLAPPPGAIATAPPVQPQPQPPVAAPPSNPPAAERPRADVGAPAGAALATFDPTKAPPPAPPHNTATPAAAWNAPTVELSRAQVIKHPRFDLGFDVEQRGPSGISRVDLWVTRDDGRTWQKWSQHDGKGGAVHVALDVRENLKLEGSYGFRLVPVSGAGLSEREPTPGDAPDLRVVLDVTAPRVALTKIDSDPNAADTLLIKWEAADANFGEDPITLEWSDSPTGPWRPVATSGTDPVVQATALNAPVAKRLPNTGQHSWRVPSGVPARVHLKITARDAAGNVTERVTVEPVLVDLTKPRAKISGIVPPVQPRP